MGDDKEEVMQNFMAEEDEDGLAKNLDSDDLNEEDDDEVHICTPWNRDLSTIMTMNDGHESSTRTISK
jgi:hypothetical protein